MRFVTAGWRAISGVPAKKSALSAEVVTATSETVAKPVARCGGKRGLEETEKSCRLKTNEWNERSKTREGEIEAILQIPDETAHGGLGNRQFLGRRGHGSRAHHRPESLKRTLG